MIDNLNDLPDGLTAVIPIGEVPIAYIEEYHMGEELSCAFCPQHQKHKHGFVTQMEDGRLAICGNICAKKYFGVDRDSELRDALSQKARIDAAQTIFAALLPLYTVAIGKLSDELLAFEDVGLTLMEDMGSRARYHGIKKLNFPGSDSLRMTISDCGGILPRRLARSRAKLQNRVALDPALMSVETLEKVVAEREAFDNDINIGLRFVREFRTLVEPPNFRHLSTFFKELQFDAGRIACIKNLDNSVVVESRKHDNSDPVRYWIGIPPADIPDIVLTPMSEAEDIDRVRKAG